MSAAAIERVKSFGGWSAYGDGYADLLRRMAENVGRADSALGNPRRASATNTTR